MAHKKTALKRKGIPYPGEELIKKKEEDNLNPVVVLYKESKYAESKDVSSSAPKSVSSKEKQNELLSRRIRKKTDLSSKSQSSPARSKLSRVCTDSISYKETEEEKEASDSEIIVSDKAKTTNKLKMSKGVKLTKKNVSSHKQQQMKIPTASQVKDDLQIVEELPQKNGHKKDSKKKKSTKSIETIGSSIKRRARKITQVQRLGTQGSRRSGRNVPVKRYNEDVDLEPELIDISSSDSDTS